MTNGDATACPTESPGSTFSRPLDQSPPLTPEDVTDDAERRAGAYRQADRHGVAVVDGFGVQVIVERAHLELHDGVGEHRRVRRYPKIDPPLRIAIGIGTVGTVSLDALRWCSQVGTPLVALSNDGSLLAVGPPGRDDARLLRAQALALYGLAGLAVTRYLISEKLRGQAEVLRAHLAEVSAAETIAELATAVFERTASIEEVRQLEAAAANVYFASFERTVEVTFARKDLPRIPTHWSRFNGRRSSINPATARNSTDPAGAVLNYAYKLAEVEAGLAARRMGLDPGIGILHADLAGRPSFACDLMESVRPVVDAHVLDVLQGPLRKREFTEDSRGVVRCLAPLTHRLAEAMPSYGLVLAPVVEHVADLLAQSSPYDVPAPTVLSGSKHKAAARARAGTRPSDKATPAKLSGPNPGRLAPRGRRRTKPSASPPLPLRACRGCGGRLPADSDRDRPRIDWCSDCLPGRRQEIGASLYSESRVAAERFAAQTGTLPAHTPKAQASRSEANARQREEQRRWSAAAASDRLDPAWFQREILPKLATFSLPAIAKATGASTTAASQWRSGKRVPHRRHWAAMCQLVGIYQALDASIPPELPE